MLEVFEPAPQYRIDGFYDRRHTLPLRAIGTLTYRVPQLLQALLAWELATAFKAVSQEFKPFRGRVGNACLFRV